MYSANTDRYQEMIYNRLGASGLKISAVSLGLWHNFGSVDSLENQKKIIHQAFDLGITYYDLANNYGPVPGSAEENFGHVLSRDMKAYRDEMIISSKAGYHMWEGPYGDWGSRKSIIASANQSLQRMGLEYFDIFYSHRPDPKTPIEETALALDQLVREGKALYIGVSNYDGKQTSAISKIFHELKTPFVVNQSRYNMFNRKIEGDLLPVLKDNNKAAVVFSPLAQGLLTNRYLNGIPDDSRAAKSSSPFLKKEQVEKTLNTVKELECVAEKREQTLAEMAIAWNLRQKEVSSVIVGASRSEQLQNSVNALKNLTFSVEELKIIDKILDDVD
ncbi:MAG: aldo/keto reductase [Leuconostoc pseudomesenteroides]|uniref:L-glyceraldehyde 3-phosphate reductase n=1 Tax=Leuconostoc pseudomesenteroides TaxID=33968 RepID=A0A5B8SWT9_LEUPS|nr:MULTISPECIES: aldo/keto reductase [Leuconostoc]MCC7669783.1 L-glyceraldehyde 3-phosphate reductase [Leuconostoc pseudomesenteroides]MCC8440896.1 L-glyceraldehyde 3-phosphate reductase [Leuconostoc pseudomesenteroides]MCT4387762.1 L-glyceraldehyde 3-phosphate reductase [Leuconostoc pseudomesenteroides]MCT4404752.1 L-glyceraldehyde 3-phosphate reductase [Leuconostoc falkenbergense]QEA41622.1 L-glyceraldehyde 3-phosphate reductase [Leuconostoc pseudomesenteroides]